MSDSGSPTRLPQSSLWANRKCLFICCLVSMANLELGIDGGVIGSLQAMPGFLAVFGYADPNRNGGYAIGSTFQQLITSLMVAGGFVSALLCGLFAQHFGRKTGIWVGCALTSIGVAVQIATESKSVVYLGRLILGIGNGFLATFAAIYTAEVAPAHLRPIMVGVLSEWMLVGGILAATVTNITQSRMDRMSYQIPMLMLLPMPVLLSIGLAFVPESPRYLFSKGKVGEARKSLTILRKGSMEEEDLELEWVEMVKGLEEERRTASSTSPMELFKGCNLRRTLLSWGTVGAHAASGAGFLLGYAAYFMVTSGLSVAASFRYFLINTCLGLVAVNFGLFLMRHVFGRRSMCILGAASNGLCMLGMAASATVPGLSSTVRLNCLIAFTTLYLFFFSCATGTVSTPLAAELVSTRLRAWTFGTSHAIGMILAWIISFTTPYFLNPEHLNWGAKYGFIWAAASGISCVWYYIFMPEMKDRTLEEIDEMFEKRVPARKFRQFRTSLLDEALADVRGRRDSGVTVTHIYSNGKSISSAGGEIVEVEVVVTEKE